ncbi:DUF5131 family protein [Litoribacter populi]|uniref:DUF5131 family protein n=1 Tax=Litoribacter populi TaxID=2598460 RepID=UPI00163D8471|nr:DUF5131 family protein [Litoribacter populi]
MTTITNQPPTNILVLDIQEQCEESGFAFFFKQWVGKNKKKAGRELNSRTCDKMPEIELQRSV